MIELNLFLSTFILIALTELGDKSFLTVLTLASRYDRKSVFVGSFCGLLLITLIGTAFGSWVSEYVPSEALLFVAAIIFLIFGSYALISRNAEEKQEITLKGSSVTLGSFFLLMLMELGDKTQISVFTLAATGDWLTVIIGAGAAFLILVGGATYLGEAIGKKVSPDMMKIISGLVFLFFGFLYLALFMLKAFN